MADEVRQIAAAPAATRSPDQAAKLAAPHRTADPRIRDRERERFRLEQREKALNRAEALAAAPLAERFAYAASLGGGYTKDRAGVQATLEVWQEWWRDILLIAARREDGAVHRDRLDTLRTLASQCDVAAAVRALRAITDARQQLAENASPVLALEAMMLALPELRSNAVSQRFAGR